MMIAPGQDRSDGKLSVIIMHGGSRIKALSVFAQIKQGGHVKHEKMVEVLRGYDVKVEFDAVSDLQIDGEVYLDVKKYSVKCKNK